jgi:hypothetical protein
VLHKEGGRRLGEGCGEAVADVEDDDCEEDAPPHQGADAVEKEAAR